MLKRNLLNPGDIRSRNNYPRAVQKSPAPNIDTIEEEDEENNEGHVSKLLVIKIDFVFSIDLFFFSFKEWKNINTIINTNDSK